jgi:hypothetical protein
MTVSGSISAYRNTAMLWILVTLLAMSLPLRSFAALGDISQSVIADQAQMKASIRIIQADSYTIHEMKSPLGTVVREYVSQSDGRVFGIAWAGPFVPDLKQLLGTYFQQYSAAAKAQRASHVGTRPLDIQEPGLVVQTAGHMRAFSGRAYDPRLLPPGVNANDIR